MTVWGQRCSSPSHMTESLRKRTPRLVSARTLPNPTAYVDALYGEYKGWALDEEDAKVTKGEWRALFGVDRQHPIDLEIGTGNGNFFAHQAELRPERCLLGVELKFKPLIQSIRRARKAGCQNARIARYDASCIEDIIGPLEVNDVFIYHPDPWPRLRDHKHRLIQDEFLSTLFGLMRPGSLLRFKTDDESYFDWSEERFLRSKFQQLASTRDLHRSQYADQNFVTHFERLFLQKGQAIFWSQWLRP